jgi:hypothetical protein
MNGMFEHIDDTVFRSKLYQLFSMLSIIVNLVTTHAIHVKTVEYIHALLKDYNLLFISTFGEIATINQHMTMHIKGS